MENIIEIYVCTDSNFEDVGPTGQNVVGEYGGGQLSNPSRDNRESAIPYQPLFNTSPTTDLDLKNPSSPNSFKGSEEPANGVFEESEEAASDDFQGDNSTGGDVNNSNFSSEEDGVYVLESELYDDYGNDVHEELRVVREDLREYKNFFL